MKLLLVYLIIVNALSLLLMLIDKRKAVKHRWRIPEKVLLSVAALGGSAGATLGMFLFRHKTRHPHFYITLPLLLSLHTVIVYLLMQKIPV